MLWESGPVAHNSCFGGLDDEELDSRLGGVYGVATLQSLRRAGGVLCSLDPPMWIVDDLPSAREYVNAIKSESCEFSESISPGNYVKQFRAVVNVDTVSSETVQRADDLVQFFATVCASQRPPTLGVKQSMPPDNVKGMEDTILHPMERLHVDRNRQKDSPDFRRPMKLTFVVSHDETGGTYFPFAKSLRPSLPDGVETMTNCRPIDARSFCSLTEVERGSTRHWSLPLPQPSGLLVAGRPGRILIFASHGTDPSTPLFSSLHQGVMKSPLEANAKRMVTVFGFDGINYESTGRHECLEYEDFETRASFFNRSIEEELVGVVLTGGTRAGEASAHLVRLSRQRNIGLDRLVREELEREEYRSNTYANEASEILSQLDITRQNGPASSFQDTLETMRRAVQSRMRHHSITRRSSSSTVSVPFQIFVRTSCACCEVKFVDPSTLPIAQESLGENCQIPGFLSCGHAVLCQACWQAVDARPELKQSGVRRPCHIYTYIYMYMCTRPLASLSRLSGRTKCIICRAPSMESWKPLMKISGKLICMTSEKVTIKMI